MLISGLTSPRGLAFGPDGKLYVCTGNAPGIPYGRVLRFLADGTPDGVFIKRIDPTQGGDTPVNITFGAQGDVYVDCNDGGLIKYDTFGNLISPFSLPGKDVVLAPNNYLFCNDRVGNIYQFPSGGSSAAYLFNDGISEDNTDALALDASGNLYASTYGGTILRWNAPVSSTSTRRVFATIPGSNGAYGTAPLGLCFDRNGDLIAGGTSCLFRFHSDGTLGDRFGDDGLLGQVGSSFYPWYPVLTPDTQKTPTLYNLSPGTVTSGVGNTTVTLIGNNFLPKSQVWYNTATSSSLLTSTYVNATTLTVNIPSSMLAYASSATITVSNFPAGGGTSNGSPFTVIGMPHLTVSLVTSGNALYYTIHNAGNVDATNIVIQNLYDGNYGWYMFPGYPTVNFLPIVPSFNLIAGASISFPNPVYFPNIVNQPPHGIQILQVCGSVDAYGEPRTIPFNLSKVFYFGGGSY